MEQGLFLARSASFVAWRTIFSNLAYMSFDGFPAFYLPGVFFRNSPAHKVTAIPQKPSLRILWVDPAFLFPNTQWLAGVNFIEI